MNSLQPLTALLAQTERQRDMATAEQIKAQVACDSAEAQAQQLLDYRREYERRWSAQFCREGHIELVRCYQGFMERLSQAVESQQRLAETARAQLERARSALLERETQLAAVRKLVERRLVQARLDGERQEQKEHDELAARIAWGRHGANGPTRAA